MRRLLAALPLVGLVSCAYASEYIAPLDGRPRVVWRNRDVAADFAGAGLSPQCARTIASAIYEGRLPDGSARTLTFDQGLRDRLLAHSIMIRPPIERFAPGWVAVQVGVNVPVNSGGSLFGNSPSGGGGGGDNAAAIIAVLAILIIGPIDMYLSMAPPEDSELASEVIDLVNLYNEAVRLELPGCVYAVRGAR